MPTIRLGGGILDARGSVGGQTIRKGRSGHLLQSRRGPVNRRSSRQSKSRAIFQLLTQYWSNNLTQAQRDQWTLYANTIVVKNKLGQSVHLTGMNHFVRSNSLLRQFEDFIHEDGPTTLSLPESDPTITSQFNFVTQKIIIFFDESRAWVGSDDGHLYVTMSEPRSPGVKNFKHSFRLLDVIHGSDTTPPTSPQEVNSAYPVAIGQKIVLKARIAEEPGRLSNFFRGTFTTRTHSRAYRPPVFLS